MRYILILLAASLAHADELRSLNTNRPSRTEVATTVDKAHLQIETDFANYVSDTAGEAWALGGTNLRFGISRKDEVELTVFPYIHQHLTGQRWQNGLSDTTLAVKHNFIGNEGGPIILAFMPYVQLPTHQDQLGSNDIEGGVVLPFSLELGESDELLSMMKAGRTRATTDTTYVTIFDSTLMYWHAFDKQWSAYAEFYNEASSDSEALWVATADVGVSFLLNPNFQLDLAGAFGLTRASDDANVLSGFSVRF
jgi:hypothetical protein